MNRQTDMNTQYGYALLDSSGTLVSWHNTYEEAERAWYFDKEQYKRSLTIERTSRAEYERGATIRS